ncbi:MAG: hypothetical protein IT376_05015 [Polyangiaceae bacterium]|nr:hypothetical protein [Polyangiaceae bacterium]
MKYTTFRALVVAGVVFAALGSCATCVVVLGSTDSPPPPSTTAPGAPATTIGASMAGGGAPSVTATPGAPPASVGAKELAVSAFERDVLAVAARPLSGDKGKDALGPRGPKVNLYRDAGEPKVNRAKVDLDRDERWDEKWTFERAGGVKRQIAPADDESYTVEYELAGGQWRRTR